MPKSLWNKMVSNTVWYELTWESDGNLWSCTLALLKKFTSWSVQNASASGQLILQISTRESTPQTCWETCVPRPFLGLLASMFFHNSDSSGFTIHQLIITVAHWSTSIDSLWVDSLQFAHVIHILKWWHKSKNLTPLINVHLPAYPGLRPGWA